METGKSLFLNKRIFVSIFFFFIKGLDMVRFVYVKGEAEEGPKVSSPMGT